MSHNQHQFKLWHDQHRPRLLSCMTALVRNRETAADVTAAALAAAWQNLNQFRGESSLYTWVYRIALNEAQNRLRRCDRTISLEGVEDSTLTALREPIRADDVLEVSEASGKLQKALLQIPARYHQVLTDHFIHGHSVSNWPAAIGYRWERFSAGSSPANASCAAHGSRRPEGGPLPAALPISAWVLATHCAARLHKREATHAQRSRLPDFTV